MSIDPFECLEDAFNRIAPKEKPECLERLKERFGKEVQPMDLACMEGSDRLTAKYIIEDYLIDLD